MKFTFDWLKDHLKTDLTPYELGEALTNLGIEVEEIVDNSKKFENFVVGLIKTTKQHPNADKLQICEVDIGGETLQIVCGAKNARAGIYVVVALVGAVIPNSDEVLKESVIRGVKSQGMICSAEELSISTDTAAGILELTGNVTLGQGVASILELDDVVFDVSITPNRADCFSVRGIARDLAAAEAGLLLSPPDFQLTENFENPVDIEIETKHCEYFSTVAVKNCTGITPKYIAKRLTAIGQKLIYPPVNIANYICIDIGQPLHIFDLNKLPSKIVVRNSRQGEKIRTLSGKEMILPDGAVVVATEYELLSIAGIMGGESSAFSDTSRNILVEGAYFDKVAVSLAGQTLRLTSDSRTRFERGIDPENVDYAVKYAVSILSKNCDCQTSNVNKRGRLPSNKSVITLSFDKFHAVTDLTAADFSNSRQILENLGFTILEMDSTKITAETPPWRHDLEIEEDIIEEILRVVGYENIKETELPVKDPLIQTYTVDKLSDGLIYNGYYEVKTFSFIDRSTAKLFGEECNFVKINDALTVDFTTLRTTVVASHLKALSDLQRRSQRNSKIFEVGKRFLKIDGGIFEENMLTATISEKFSSRHWRKKQEYVSIYDMKEVIEKLLDVLNVNARLMPGSHSYYHPGKSGTYVIQRDTALVQFGEIHPTILSEMNVTGPVICFELFLDKLPELYCSQPKAPITISQYQPTMRDFSFVVPKSVTAIEMMSCIKKLHINEIKDICVFDVYESKNIGAEKKAVALEILLQSDNSTLAEEQISEISKKIVQIISNKYHGTLRKQ
ncbi:MAG: phenylalanine--tRNA ligase subunit beta [Holosporales bacterium]|jgi:phenylalanyl-tRNA synthetase beta chain|nr:phenylalanine--tRNA ligase subunit beta [Holosporales bacterium]